jgi:hypothetical protein
MTTLATMRARIADELVNEEITDAQIDRAIVSAIQMYDDGNWWFNQETDTFPTVAAQENYTSADLEDLANIVDFVSMSVTVSSSKTPVIGATYKEIDSLQDGSVTGVPTHFTTFAEQLRLYPIPDDAYTISVSYAYKLTMLAAGADTNAWMTSGEILIRQTAKMLLAADVLHADDMVSRISPWVTDAHSKLKSENAKRMPKKTLTTPAMLSRNSYNINRG